MYVCMYGMRIYATRSLKGNISNTNKREVGFFSFVVIVFLKCKH